MRLVLYLLIFLPVTTTAQTNTFPASGNVGIGTSSPFWNLEVGGTGSGKGILMASGDEAFVGWYDRSLKSMSIDNRWGWYANNGSTYLWDGLNASNRLTISNTGNVGIGTTTPGSYRLAVAGKVAANEEVRVFGIGTTTFPDYVFDPNYKLPSLEETEAFIKENRHLPEVPPAEEVSQNGMSLNEMNIILLKKVEELTLHLIKLEKENKELMKRVDKIEKEK